MHVCAILYRYLTHRVDDVTLPSLYMYFLACEGGIGWKHHFDIHPVNTLHHLPGVTRKHGDPQNCSAEWRDVHHFKCLSTNHYGLANRCTPNGSAVILLDTDLALESICVEPQQVATICYLLVDRLPTQLHLAGFSRSSVPRLHCATLTLREEDARRRCSLRT